MTPFKRSKSKRSRPMGYALDQAWASECGKKGGLAKGTSFKTRPIADPKSLTNDILRMMKEES